MCDTIFRILYCAITYNIIWIFSAFFWTSWAGLQEIYMFTHSFHLNSILWWSVCSFLQGYKITDSKGEADVWILNSCTVKSPAEDHFRNEVNRGLDDGKKVVVAGCVPQGKPDAEYIRGLSVVGVQQIDRVVEVVEETLKGNQVSNLVLADFNCIPTFTVLSRS